jgi:Cu-processing system permease protein
MSTTAKILKYQLQDVLRSRWVIGYSLIFLLLTLALFWFGGDVQRVVLSLMNVVLLFIPLVSLLFGTLYLYYQRDFIEMLLAQPVGRGSLFAGLYAGLAGPLALAFILGIGLPCAIYGATDPASAGSLAVLVATGVLLTLVFTALACVVALAFEDRATGLGVALLLWLWAAVLYDGVVLLVAVVFGDYPLELPMITLTLANPIDLGRILLLLRFDIAALMGYTGAVFERFFGSARGVALSAIALLLWTAVPLAIGLRRFRRKDF